MPILMIVAIVYLIVGFIYAVYILLFAGDVWYWFPVNLVLGPIFILTALIAEIRRPRTVL